MRNVSLLLFLIMIVTGVLSPKYGMYRHALADEIAYKAGTIRGDNNPLTKAAFHVIQATKRSPYLLPSSLVQSNSIEIIHLAKEITKGKRTDKEKSKAIYGWMTHHISYDYGEYQRLETDHDFTYESALDTLKERKGICMGYSRLNAALHRAAGIEAKIVYGEEHAWNQVKINGIWEDQDTTYGSGYTDVTTHQFVANYNEKYFAWTDKRWEGEYEW